MTLFGVGRRDARRAAAVAARAEAAWAWALWAAPLVLLLLLLLLLLPAATRTRTTTTTRGTRWTAGGNVLSAWGSKVQAPVPSGQEVEEALGGARR
jgi:hypothetical protein